MLRFSICFLFVTISPSESLAPVPHHTPSPAPYHPTPTPYHSVYSPYSPSPAPYTPTPAPYTPSPTPYHSKPAPYHPAPHKKGYCDPKLPPYCANATGLHYCLEDPHYPEYDIKLAISQDYLFEKKFTDVPDQTANDLVQHLDKYVEDAFNYNYYTGASKGLSPYDITHWVGPEGYLCPSEVLYAMPKRARNVNGDWRVIVNNANYYTQTTRLETCLTPDSACRLLAPCYQSKCTQKYVYERMLAYDPCDPYKGLFIDVFKFPSACSCHIPQPHPPPPHV